MYPKNAASPERIAIGPVVQISDGAVQTSGVSVKVLPQGTTASAGGGTVAYEEGIVHYVPTQAETNYTSFVLIAYKTGCIPATTTVVTSASATAGTVLLAPVTHTSAVIPTVTTTTTATNLTNLPSIPSNWLTAAGIAASALNGKGDWNVGKTGYSLTATTGLGNQTANITGNLSGSVGSVTGAVGSVTGSVGSVTGAVGSVTGNVGGSVASVTGAVGSVTSNVNAVLVNGAHGGAAATLTLGGAGGLTATHTGNTTGSVGSVTGAVGSVTGAVGSVTGSVGSVIGNVGGNVVGSVGSVVGHTPQTGDAFARLGAPAGASVSADVAAVKSQTAAIEVDTADIQSRLPAALVSGRIDASVGAMAANVMTAAAAAADLTTELQSGLATAAALATAQGDITAILADTAAMPTAAGIADAVWDEAISGHLTAGSTGAAVNAAGSAGDPWATPLPGAYGAGTAGKIIGDNIDAAISSISGGGLDAAGVRAAIGLASANLDTQLSAIDTVVDSILVDTAEIGTAGAGLTALASAANLATVAGYLDTEIAAILADTNELQTDWANGGRLDLILDARASQASVDGLPTNAELATALGDIPTATQNADALLNRDMAAVSDTNARSPLNALRFIRNKWSIAGTTLTVTKEDDATEAWTATVSTTAGADPVTGNDPA